MKRTTPIANKAAQTLAESNVAADAKQAEAQKATSSDKKPTREQLAAAGYRFPAEHFDSLAEPEQPSTEQVSGDGGASLSAKK